MKFNVFEGRKCKSQLILCRRQFRRKTFSPQNSFTVGISLREDGLKRFLDEITRFEGSKKYLGGVFYQREGGGIFLFIPVSLPLKRLYERESIGNLYQLIILPYCNKIMIIFPIQIKKFIGEKIRMQNGFFFTRTRFNYFRVKKL